MIVAALAAAACTGSEGKRQPLGSAPGTGNAAGVSSQTALSPEARAALDSGNALYRAKNFQGALTQYRLAAKLAPEHAATYYGIYMVAGQLHDQKLADSAMALVNAHAGNAAPMFNDSLMKKAHTEAQAAAPKS